MHALPGTESDAGSGRDQALTWAELVFDQGRVERWIRFGAIARTCIVSRRNRFVAFRPGERFAFVRWAAGERGTVVSRLDILAGARAGCGYSTVPGVVPGGELLLRLSGWARVRQALAAIDAVEAAGIAPETAAPDYWRHVHNRLSAGEPPRPYSRERHAAWLIRDGLSS